MSVFKIPFSLSEVIPDSSFLRDLKIDQNILHFSFFGAISVSKEKILELSEGFLYMCFEPFVMVLNVWTA